MVYIIGNIKDVKDTQCGFKLFTRKAVSLIFMHQKIRRWSFDCELFKLAEWQNISKSEVAIKWEEIPGSKLTVIKAGLQMIRELLWMRFCAATHIWYRNL